MIYLHQNRYFKNQKANISQKFDKQNTKTETKKLIRKAYGVLVRKFIYSCVINNQRTLLCLGQHSFPQMLKYLYIWQSITDK